MFGAVLGSMVVLATPAVSNVQTFRIGEVEFTLQPPPGFCTPTGQAAAAIQMTSASDDGNITHLALVRCTDKDASDPDYYLLKTPKTTISSTYERTAFLAELTKAMALPVFNTQAGVVDNRQIEKRYNEVVGDKAQIDGAIKPLGHDDVCAYMGGVLTFTSPQITYKRATSLCLTTVGGKVIGITRYSDGATPSNVVRHFATVRAMALAIKVKK